MKGEQLAVIKEAHFIKDDDRAGTCIYFTTYIDEHSAAAQYITLKHNTDQFGQLMKACNGNIPDLNGKVCWVDTSTSGMIIYKRMWDER